MITRQPCKHPNKDLRAYDPFVTITAFINEQFTAALCPAYLLMFVFFVYSEDYTSPSPIHI